jgi:hypothetical protein
LGCIAIDVLGPTSGLFSWVHFLRKTVHFSGKCSHHRANNVERIVIDGGEIEIVRKAARTSSASGEMGEGGDTLKVYRAPLPAPQLRARKEIVVPGEPTPRRVNHGLILAIARAKTWMQGFRDGRYQDIAEIAQRFKLNDAHVRRLLRFGYLAPDIVEAVVEGRQPHALTVRRLLQGDSMRMGRSAQGIRIRRLPLSGTVLVRRVIKSAIPRSCCKGIRPNMVCGAR